MQAELPEGLEAYAASPLFTEADLPEALRRRHALKAGTWGKLEVLSGSLVYVALAEEEGGAERRLTLTAGDSLAIAPELPHRVEARAGLRCRVVFHRRPQGDAT